jgi:hypothetical protein
MVIIEYNIEYYNIIGVVISKKQTSVSWKQREEERILTAAVHPPSKQFNNSLLLLLNQPRDE